MIIRDLPHILTRVFGTPLLIQADKLDALIIGLNLAMQRRGPRLDPTITAGLIDPPEPEPSQRPRGYRINRGVAVVPVHGVLARRAGQLNMSESTEFQSYENLTSVIRAATSDRRVSGILLDIDSPGGEAGGIFDFTQEIRRAADRKPVHAIANDDALSAGYAIAAAADRVWVTDTGAAGSVGVVAVHLDQSRLDAEEGLQYSYLYRGAHKIDANAHSPLTPEARVSIQAEVDRLYDKFIDNVAQHRRLERDAVRRTEAEVYYGDNARLVGFADRVGTLDEAHAALADQIASPSATRSQRMETDAAIETNVVNLDEARSLASGQARANAAEIAGLVALAFTGRPALAAKHLNITAQFIADNASLETVRAELQRLVASASASSIEAIDTTQAPTPRAVADVQAANAERFRAYQTPVR